jgi:uncharacterized protein YndB with AHSA1/START domain
MGGRLLKHEAAAGSPATVRVVRRLHAAPARVFEAWLNPRIAEKWLFATATRPAAGVRMDVREGGEYCFVENGGQAMYAGEYIEIVRPRRLVFTLRLPDITWVTAQFAPLGTRCELVVTHDRLPPHLAGAMQARWTGMLYGLGVVLARRAGREPATAGRPAARGVAATALLASRTWD